MIVGAEVTCIFGRLVKRFVRIFEELLSDDPSLDAGCFYL